jgi:inner membrane protein
MDNVTHTLTGLMMARAGLGKSAGRGSAVMIMLAANAPDMDVFYSGLPGSLRYLDVHRGYTHALAMVPLVALVPLLLSRWLAKSSINWSAYVACIIGVLSHLAMDWTNVYGVRLFLPFSSRWLRLDITNIVDPWILLIFALAMMAPWLGGMVGSEIGERKSSGAKRAWAVVALIALVGYEGFREASHARGIAMMEAHLYDGKPAVLVAAVPHIINPLRWRGIVETVDSVRNLDLNVTQDDTATGEVDFPAQASPALTAARMTEPFRAFERFNQLPFWKVTPAGEYTRVQLIDLRFGTPQRPGFATTAIVAADGRVIDSRFGLGPLTVTALPTGPTP